MDLMDYRRQIIASSPHLSHAEGAVATFSDGTDLPLKSLLVNIEPVQSGSGDPSPTNIRPISGWSTVTIKNGSTTSATISLGRTVYGGKLDVLSGELVIDRKYEKFDGSADETWYTYSSTGFRVPKTGIGQSGNGICNLAPTVSSASSYGVMFSANAKYIYFFQTVSRWGVATVADLRTWLATNNVEVCYELATPLTYTIDPQTVRSLVGQNNIFADTGNVALDYWAHP